jgi:hypothetical protein
MVSPSTLTTKEVNMNIKAFMALAVVSLTAACASEEPKQAVKEVTVEEAAATEAAPTTSEAPAAEAAAQPAL